MKKIKLKFLDCWNGHRPEKDRYYKLLSKLYEIELCDDPDYIIDRGFGHDHLNPCYDRCIKIVSMGENMVPDFNCFDYAIGFDLLEFGDRYLRQPLFAFHDDFLKFNSRELLKPTHEELLNREFCSFVVTNRGGDPMRAEFFHRLSQYKKVSSGGAYLNNIGGRVKDKAAFCARFKFNIAFENSVSCGYTTEKVMQPLVVHSVPIYYGNPRVDEDFTAACMVRVKDRSDVERAIDEIVYLDTHDEAYIAKATAPCLTHSVDWYDDRMIEFLKNIFDPPKENVCRVVRYGMQPRWRRKQWALYWVDDTWRAPFRLLNRAKIRIKESMSWR